MIKLIKHGGYKLIETRRQIKILTLDDERSYAWINAGTIEEILVASHKPHKADQILAIGKYRIYEVKDEQKLTDLIHLELLAGDGIWQGYLLTKGLPSMDDKRKIRIIATSEVITKSIE